MTSPDISEPKPGHEEGSIFDYLAGDAMFSEPTDNALNKALEIKDAKDPRVDDIAEMLDNDGKARSLEQVLTLPVRKSTWKISPTSSGDKQSEDIADRLTGYLQKGPHAGGMQTPMSDVIAQKSAAFVFRRSFHEKVWKREGLGLVYDKVAWRPPQTCTLLRNEKTGDLMGFEQEVHGKNKPASILLPYASIYIHGHQREPVKGLSDLQVAYRNYKTKENIKYLWFTYLECLSLPRQIIRGSHEEGAKKAAKAVAALKNAGVAGIPSEWVEGIDSIQVGGGASAAQFEDALRYLDSDSATSILAGFTELPARASAGTGSNALSQNQSSFYLHMMEAYARELAENITMDLLSPLVYWNWGPHIEVPQFEFDDLDPRDESDAYNLLFQLATAPTNNLPDEFVKELTLQVARDLRLNPTEIEKEIDSQTSLLQQTAATPSQEQLAPVAATASVGAQAAQQAAPQVGLTQ